MTRHTCCINRTFVILSLCLSVQLLLASNNSTLAVSQNAFVGSTPIDLSVSTNGQPELEIPINLPSGPGGLTPEISICYDGMSIEGILGWGFFMKGISKIARTNSNLMTDGVIQPLSLSDSDALSLDGVRLINDSSDGKSLNGADFYLEFGNLAKVNATQSMASFSVSNQDGSVARYGSSSNSRVYGQGKENGICINWYLDEYEDKNGNYFTIQYNRDSIGECIPKTISYGMNKNGSSTPIYTIEFTYTPIRATVLDYVSPSTRLRGCHRLKNISVSGDGKLIRKYELKYKGVGVATLGSVTEYGSDATSHYNPIQLSWFNDWDASYSQTPNDALSAISKSKFRVGDFNGDGFEDILSITGDDRTWDSWNLYLGAKNGNVSLSASCNFNLEGCCDVIIADFSGDGKMDVLLKRYKKPYYHYYLLTYRDNTLKPFSSISIATETREHICYAGDFNGDHKSDLYIVYTDSYEAKVRISPIDSPFDEISKTYTSQQKWEDVYVSDFNGDGLDDLLNIHSAGYELSLSNGKDNFISKAIGTSPSSDSKVFIGDFNGDGKGDILEAGYKSYVWNHFDILFGTSIGGFRSESFNAPFDPNKTITYVRDIDGNMKDDLITVNSDGPYKGDINVHSLSLSGFYPDISTISDDAECNYDILFADIQGLGKCDFILYPNSTDKWDKLEVKLYTNSSAMHYLLQSVTDGLGNKTNFDYSLTTDKNTYLINDSYSYPIIPFVQPLKIISNITKSDGCGGNMITSYTYQNGSIHLGGRGFLGFRNICVSDPASNSVKKTELQYDSQYYLPALKSVAEYGYSWNNLRSQTTYNNVTQVIGSGTITYLPDRIETKSYDHNTNLLYQTNLEQITYNEFGLPILNVKSVNGNDSVSTSTTYTIKNNIPLPYFVEYTYSRANLAPAIKSSEYHYDDHYNVTTQIDTNNGVVLTTTTKYDIAGNKIEETISTDTGSRTNKYVYDRYLFLQKEIDNGGFSSSHAYTVDGQLMSSTSFDGLTNTYQYSPLGNLTKTVAATGSTETATLWSNGNTDAPSNAKYYTYTKQDGFAPVIVFYDSYGRKLREKNIVFGNRETYKDWIYYANGKLKQESATYFKGDSPKWNTYTYDGYGRLVKINFCDGTECSYSHVSDLENGNTVNYYDTHDQLGHFKRVVSNSYGEIIKVLDNDYSAINYAYDSEGHLTSITGPNKTIEITYDAMGNRSQIIDSDAGQYSYSYNEFGQLISKLPFGKNFDEVYTYDKSGLLISKTIDDYEYIYGYDTAKRGLVLSKTYDSSATEIHYEYDEANRPVREERYIVSKEYVMTYDYDNADNLSSITYPNGLKIQYLYDDNGNVKQLMSGGITIWTREAVNEYGRTIAYSFGNGLKESLIFDSYTGKLTEIKHGALLNHTYQYDAAGNIITISSKGTLLTEKVESFVYDALDRLTKCYLNGQLYSQITYDRAGNILNKSDIGDISYESGNNRLESVNPNSGTSLLTWPKITYDVYGRTSAVRTETDSYSIRYGADEQRSMMIISRYNTQSRVRPTYQKYYFGDYFEEIINDGNIEEICKIYVDGRMIAIVKGNSISNIQYIHSDHLGSIELITDKDCNVVSTRSYDAWGRVRDFATFTPTPFQYETIDVFSGYCGHEHLNSAGVINMNGRIYDPAIGRFLSPDRLIQSPDNTQNLNRYSYCLNNPLIYKDPTGNFFFIDDFIVGFCKGLFKGKNPLKEGWRQTRNTYNIIKGTFATGFYKHWWGPGIEILSRFTWEFPQTMLGLVAAHGYNMFGSVNSVKSIYGATVLQTKNMSENAALTLGNFIIGGKGIEADPNNSTFQHEYGHYIQSKFMGTAYLTSVGLPSISSAITHNNHRYQIYERDANFRAFVFFNKRVPGFYRSEDDWKHYKEGGWNFKENPLVNKEPLNRDDYYRDFHERRDFKGINTYHSWGWGFIPALGALIIEL